MSQVRLLVDEDAQHRALAPALRARGVDVVTVGERGLTGADDDVVLAHAVQDGRAVYTFNTGDFCRLHDDYMQQGREHAGIICVPRQRYSVGEQIRRLFQLINTKSAEEMRNQLEFL
jgi:predicted nuclease of predicted toxin-antitoxin system